MRRLNRRALSARSSKTVLEMAKTKFGVSIDDEIAYEIDELVDECADLGASRSEIVEAVLTAYLDSDVEHGSRVRELIIRRRKGTI
jgi:metal-responsive CopG/Arc/MetJ family transcriptional regulator